MKVILVFNWVACSDGGFDVLVFDSENDLQIWLLENYKRIETDTIKCWTHCREAHYIPHLLAKGET